MNNQSNITAIEAQKMVDGMINYLSNLRKAAYNSGLSDKWLDRQFVVSRGNLTDLSYMFRSMNEVQAKKNAKEKNNGKNASNI